MAHILFIIPILLSATLWLYFLTCIAPDISINTKVQLGFPGSFQEMKDLAYLLKLYYNENWVYVLALFSSAYLYKQSFSIPGSVFLNVLAGALFGVFLGFPLVCLLTAIGSSICYLLSYTFGRQTIQSYFPAQTHYLQHKVEQNSHQLIYYLLFLRLFPMTPNWLINLISPIVEVPLHLFFITIFLGLMPYNFLCVQAGGMLASISKLEDVMSTTTLVQLAVMAAVALGPSFFLKKSKEDELNGSQNGFKSHFKAS